MIRPNRSSRFYDWGEVSPSLVEQRQNVVDGLVFSLSQHIRLGKARLRDSGTRVFLASLVDDVGKFLLRAEALLFQQFHNGRHPQGTFR